MIISFNTTNKLAIKHNVPDPLFTGQKTVTRRVWAERTINTYRDAFDNGKLIHKAYNKSTFAKGAYQIGTIEMTVRPYLEKLIDMPIADLELEGGFWNSKQEFIDLVGKGNSELMVCVVRFKFEAL